MLNAAIGGSVIALICFAVAAKRGPGSSLWIEFVTLFAYGLALILQSVAKNGLAALAVGIVVAMAGVVAAGIFVWIRKISPEKANKTIKSR